MPPRHSSLILSLSTFLCLPGHAADKSLLYITQGDLALKFGGRLKLDLYQDINSRQANSAYGFDASNLPLKRLDFDAKRKGHTNICLTGSRLNLEINNVLSTYPVKAFVEADFSGRRQNTTSSYQPRLRHLYLQSPNLLAGQTFYTFSDTDAFIPTLDNPYGPGFQAMIRYQLSLSPKLKLIMAVEKPNVEYYQYVPGANTPINNGYMDNDATHSNSQSSYPDGAMKLIYQEESWHMALRGIARDLRVKTRLGENDSSLNVNKSVLGWGLGVSTAFKFSPCLKFLFQANGGKGVGRYIDDLDASKSLSAYFQYPSGTDTRLHFEALKTVNLIGGVVLNWTGDLSSAFAYSRTSIAKPKGINSSTIQDYNRCLQRYVINIIYRLSPRGEIGIEGLHYIRKAGVNTSLKGKNTRLMASFTYRF